MYINKLNQHFMDHMSFMFRNQSRAVCGEKCIQHWSEFTELRVEKTGSIFHCEHSAQV